MRKRPWILPAGMWIVAGVAVIMTVMDKQRDYLPATELPEGLQYVAPRQWAAAHATDRFRPNGWIRLVPDHNEEAINKPRGDASKPDDPHYIGPETCADCHPKKFEGYSQTAHYRTSRTPDLTTIQGSFDPGENHLKTRNEHLHYEMQSKSDGLYQTVFIEHDDQVYSHAGKIDIVTGSGNHAQTFLSWKNDRLYELPVTHFTDGDQWVNSPNYVDGTADFARPVPPSCLECHATYFKYVEGSLNRYVKDRSILGISCERCHGPGSSHVEFHRNNPDATDAMHIIYPGNLPRLRKIEICAQCHSGGTVENIRPHFSYRPGEPLDEYKKLDHTSKEARTGVHTANQYARLSMSRCFTENDEITCISCHDPHQNEHGNLALFSKRCLKCHEVTECRMAGEQSRHSTGMDCITCHMPKIADTATPLENADDIQSPLIRDHFIRIVSENRDHTAR